MESTKEVDLGEPTSFLDQVYLGCAQRECETSKDVEENYRNMFESGISAGAKEKLPCSGKPTQTSPHGPMIWKVMQRNVWSDVASWRTKPPSNCTKLQLHVLMTINSRKKNWDLLENCQKDAHRLFSNACIWPVLVDLIFYVP